MTRALLLVIVVGAGCHHADQATNDGGADAACADSCVPGWWEVVTGGCSAFCSLSPKPRECQASDCQQVVFYDIVDGGHDSQLQALLSMGDKTFTLFTNQPGAWKLPSQCHLSLDPQTDPNGSMFSCSDTMLMTPTRTWSRLVGPMQAAVEATSMMTLPAQGSY